MYVCVCGTILDFPLKLEKSMQNVSCKYIVAVQALKLFLILSSGENSC